MLRIDKDAHPERASRAEGLLCSDLRSSSCFGRSSCLSPVHTKPNPHAPGSSRSRSASRLSSFTFLTSFTSPISFPVISFADPHPINSVVSYPYKNEYPARIRVPSDHRESRASLAPLSPLAATLMDLPANVVNKRLTSSLNPLDATLTKNRGWVPGRALWATQSPIFPNDWRYSSKT